MFKQVLAATAMNLRSLPQRFAASMVVVIGIGGVVGVLITVLAMASGLSRTFVETGRPDRALILHKAANTESFSNIDLDWTVAIAQPPEVLRGAEGTAAVCPERIVGASLSRRAGGEAGVTLRGTCPAMYLVHPEWRLVAGRQFRPGLHEVMVGMGAFRQFSGVDVGDHVKLGTSEWTVVGRFTSDGDVHESEVLTDATTLMSAYGWTDYSSVTVRLKSETALGGYRKALLSNPSLQVEVLGERDYYQRQSQGIANLLYLVSTVVGAIMAIGAVLTATNILYSAVAGRRGEIATLRAIGFGAFGVVSSILVESLLLAIVGALLGALVAWLAFSGNVLSTSAGAFDAQVMFTMVVRPGLIALGVLWGVTIGLLGGLLPAVRAARMPVAVALRPV
jgi:putative ABC transport system permease protein